MVKLYFSFFLCVLSFGLVIAQDTNEAVHITDADVERFIETFEPMKADFEKLGSKYEDVTDPSKMQMLKASVEAKAILKKYGWDEEYFEKVQTIISSYSYVQIKEEYAKLPADQQAMMQSVLAQMRSSMGTEITAADIAAVKRKLSEIQRMFDAAE